MNGATTELFAANNNKPPKTTMTTIIGKSHNFLRTLKNFHNSLMNDIDNLGNFDLLNIV
jgi:hypothetical protein